MSKLPTIEELREQLEAAEQKAEATDAAMLNQTDIDDQTLADLETQFEEEKKEVERLTAALNRRAALEEARAAVPRIKEDDTPITDNPSPRIQTNEPLTYRPFNEGGKHSFFKDLYSATKQGNPGAQSRLARHQREMETLHPRADITAGSGDFVPPQHLQDEWISLARAGRVFANQVRTLPMPPVGTSFTIPRVTTGTSTAAQGTEGTAVSETDAVRDDVTLTVRTIAGQQDMSRQAFERSEPGLDDVLFADLAADYATTLDAHLLNDANDGLLNNANINSVTYTDTTPTVAEMYPKLADAWSQIGSGRFMSPDAVFMHTRRWAFFLAALDSQNRPLITPVAPQNPVAGFEQNAAEGVVGISPFGSVFADPNIPTNLGAGNDEDAIILTRTQDLLLFETPTPVARVFEETLSGTLQVRIQVYGYIAFTSDRYGEASAKITGTGLIAPTF